jgi:type I restriction enzyme S subunit
MNRWPEVRVGDLGTVITGRTPPSEQDGLFGNDTPFITPGDMHQGKYARETQRSLSYDGAALLRRIIVPADSVCVSCIGWQMGEVIITDRPSCTNQQINSIIVNDKALSSFLYYSLRPRKQELLNRGAGAGVRTPIMNKSVFCNVTISLPPLSTQRRIASILGAYDDLIEVNRRRIKLLEEMARGLFEEWFVRFRFPGHETVPLLDTPDGSLPEGWDIQEVAAVTAYINRGIAPKYDKTSTTLVIGQKCVRDQRVSLQPARKQSKTPPLEKIVRPGDILINSTGVGTLGRVAQVESVPERLTVDSHVTIVRPSHNYDRDYLGLKLLALQPVFEHFGTGSTGQTELSRSSIGTQKIIWPAPSVRQRFGEVVRPMRQLVHELLNQSEKLAASRDLLLPRLISGQLSVEAAEQQLAAE